MTGQCLADLSTASTGTSQITSAGPFLIPAESSKPFFRPRPLSPTGPEGTKWHLDVESPKIVQLSFFPHRSPGGKFPRKTKMFGGSFQLSLAGFVTVGSVRTGRVDRNLLAIFGAPNRRRPKEGKFAARRGVI